MTLKNSGVAPFPDAPTERGVKHLKELCAALKEGFESYLFFVIQMKNAKLFTPNDVPHPAFGDTLRCASKEGVKIIAMDCQETPDSLSIGASVEVKL